jgi:hypothetical protein
MIDPWIDPHHWSGFARAARRQLLLMSIIAISPV